MNKLIQLFFAVLLMLLQHLSGFAQPHNADEAAIRETLTHYIEGRNGGDLDRLKRAFHPTAALKFVQPETGALGEWSLEEYLGRLEPGKKQNCSGQIADVRLFQDAAQATVILTYPSLLFHDYISLLKIEGKWLIIDKTFARKPLEEAVDVGGIGSPQGKVLIKYRQAPQEASCEICTKQEYRDKSAQCPHNQ